MLLFCVQGICKVEKQNNRARLASKNQEGGFEKDATPCRSLSCVHVWKVCSGVQYHKAATDNSLVKEAFDLVAQENQGIVKSRAGNNGWRFKAENASDPMNSFLGGSGDVWVTFGGDVVTVVVSHPRAKVMLWVFVFHVACLQQDFSYRPGTVISRLFWTRAVSFILEFSVIQSTYHASLLRTGEIFMLLNFACARQTLGSVSWPVPASATHPSCAQSLTKSFLTAKSAMMFSPPWGTVA